MSQDHMFLKPLRFHCQGAKSGKSRAKCVLEVEVSCFFVFWFFLLFVAEPSAHGSSQARS